MKKISTISLCLVLAGWNASAKKPVNPNPAWESTVIQQIMSDSYRFHPQPKNVYAGANQKNDFTCQISSTGYTIDHLDPITAEKWKASFQLVKIANQPTRFIRVSAKEKSVLSYQYTNATVRYTNDEHGLRQDFIVNEKSKSAGPLTVMMDVNSALKPKLSANNQLMLSSADGQPKLIYDDLHVWDANHRTLDASFVLQGNHVKIVVNDEKATYPVTIDPLTRRADWNSSASGLLTGIFSGELNTALYGFKVAYIGDVNNDGFGDAAVGAPGLLSVASGSSLAKAGAVFIFHGSATGLATTPSNILQPNSVLAGALFGASIDGADIDGDGYSDVIVGAPLDGFNATISLSTQLVTAGKVYVYSGSTLASNNPTPLLSLNIDPSRFGPLNFTVKALFGFSVAFTDDLNGDGKKDIIVGAPGFQGSLLTSVKGGGAFVFTSTGTNTYNAGTRLSAPGLLNTLGVSLPIENLLFGYSVDGAGDFNNDGKMDVVVGAPGGDGITSILSSLAAGQVLSGKAVVYYGTGTGVGVNTTPGTQLYAGNSALLGAVGNLFGFAVKGMRNVAGARDGRIAVGAPLAGTLTNALSLNIKTGSVHIFLPKTTPAANEQPFQVIESPRSSSLLNILNNYQVSALMGASIDNMYDANGDGLPDLVVGEPLSTGTNLAGLQAAATGGTAYVYAGIAGGGFNTTPIFTVDATYGGSFLSVNAAPLFAYSVAGIRNLLGSGTNARVMVGSPASSLDFSSGLLNIGGSVGTLMDFAAGNNGPGNAYTFDALNNTPLAAHLLSFSGMSKGTENLLYWKTAANKEITGFELQRSGDGKSWMPYQKVAAKEASTQTNYEVRDLDPLANANYYRLKVNYTNGKDDYSQVVLLRNDLDTKEAIAVFPNPVVDVLRIKTTREGGQQLRVISQLGTTLCTRVLGANADGINTFSKEELKITQPGTYIIEVVKSDGTATHQAILVQ